MVSRFLGFGSRPDRSKGMTPNNAGGMSFSVDDMTRLKRFLILSSVGGTFYVGERKLTKENLDVVERLLAADKGRDVISLLVEISEQGRAISNDPALFVLARCCAADDVEVRRYAYGVLPKVARTGTHLFHFLAFVEQFRGHGRAHGRALKRWYNEKTAAQLAYQMVKYQQRDGWSQRDVLRVARPHAPTEEHNLLYKWAVKQDAEGITEENLPLIWAYEQAKRATDEKEVATLIQKYRLPREAVPTHFLNSVVVWEALLQDMPMEAMVRNLATMTRNGVLQPMGEMTKLVVERLRNQDAIVKARLHPIKILSALTTYRSGRGVRSTATWTPLQPVLDALNDAFYLAFKAVEPTGKRLLLAIDTSASMRNTMVNGVPFLTAHSAAAAMALVTASTESNYHVVNFDTRIADLPISPRQRLDDVVALLRKNCGGGTNCALPMEYALQKDLHVDAFVVYTDSETWQGKQLPVQALKTYREKVNPEAKMINVQMTSTHVTNNDPSDLLSLECVGFDTTTPQAIAEFLTL